MNVLHLVIHFIFFAKVLHWKEHFQEDWALSWGVEKETDNAWEQTCLFFPLQLKGSNDTFYDC